MNWTNGAVILEGVNLPRNITNSVVIGKANKVMGSNSLTLTTTGVKAGLFTGSVSIQETKTVKTINGAVLQNENIGYGWFLGTNQSGSVSVIGD